MLRKSAGGIAPGDEFSGMVRPYDFVELTARWPRTAAARLPIVLLQDAVGAPQTLATNFHRDFCSLYVIRRGRGTHVIDGVRYGIARGDVYAMGPGMSHRFENSDNLVMDTFHFQPTLFDRETRDALATTPGFHSLFVRDASSNAEVPAGGDDGPLPVRRERWLHLTPTQHTVVLTAISELQAEWSEASADSASVLLTRALFLRLLVCLSRFHAESRPAADTATNTATAPLGFAGGYEETVAVAVRYMEEHFSERLRIERIAALVFLSPDRFTSVFSAVMGRTPRDYLHHLRVEHAKMLLATTTEPMGHIAQAAGFAEPAYFTRVLRAATGVSPTTYRRTFTG